MKRELKSIEDFKSLKEGNKIEIHSNSKVNTATVVAVHENGDLDTDVDNFGEDVLIRAVSVLSGKSKVFAIYVIQD